MSELEEKLNTLMSNPQLMQQIAALAQTMGQPEPEPPQPAMSCWSVSRVAARPP